jgi:hypothetical protein
VTETEEPLLTQLSVRLSLSQVFVLLVSLSQILGNSKEQKMNIFYSFSFFVHFLADLTLQTVLHIKR